MTLNRRRIWLLAGAILALLAIEAGREHIFYTYGTRQMEKNYWQLRKGMSREQVRGILGDPVSVMRERGLETWTWSPREHAGPLLLVFWRVSPKKHYELIATFAETGHLADFFSAAN